MKVTQDQIKEALKFYKQSSKGGNLPTLKEVAAAGNFSTATAKKALQEAGLPVRGRGRPVTKTAA